MAKYGSNVAVVKLSVTSATSSFNDMSQYVRAISAIDQMAILAESHTLGDSYKEQSYVGVNELADITISGFYDDTATSGPDVVFGTIGNLGAERCLKVNFGTANVFPKVDVLIKSYKRTAVVGELTGFEVVLTPTGAMTIATT